jgi:hypothetical protein
MPPTKLHGVVYQSQFCEPQNHAWIYGYTLGQTEESSKHRGFKKLVSNFCYPLWRFPLFLLPLMTLSTIFVTPYDAFHYFCYLLWRFPLFLLPLTTLSTIFVTSYDAFHYFCYLLWRFPLFLLPLMTLSTVFVTSYDAFHYFCPFFYLISTKWGSDMHSLNGHQSYLINSTRLLQARQYDVLTVFAKF